MLTVVGLGNPGVSYVNTRHNVGFMLLDGLIEGSFSDCVHVPLKGINFLRRFLGAKASFKKSHGLYVSIEAEISGNRCYLVKPTTFMNESGKALTSLRTRGVFKDVSELLIIVDDINLDIGRMKLRSKGSAGGHNGLKSIIRHLGTDEFTRLRIGVGPRPNSDDMVNHVLGSFRPNELESLYKSLENAACIVESCVKGGVKEAQNVFARLK